jgi:hypothetical protein
VLARRPRSQSAAETTGLKCAPETGPNIKMSTVNPRKVAVEFSSSCSPTSPVESRWAAMPEPTTTVTSKPVPSSSATRRRVRVSVTR